MGEEFLNVGEEFLNVGEEFLNVEKEFPRGYPEKTRGFFVKTRGFFVKTIGFFVKTIGFFVKTIGFFVLRLPQTGVDRRDRVGDRRKKHKICLVLLQLRGYLCRKVEKTNARCFRMHGFGGGSGMHNSGVAQACVQ